MKQIRPILYALLAALLFGLNAPFAKLLVREIDPLFLAALLYLGAGIGMFLMGVVRKRGGHPASEAALTRKDAPFVLLMILLDIAAPILLLLGIRLTSAGTASLLGNFEIVATALAAMLVFRETVGRRLWTAIALISAASVILSVGDLASVHLSPGAVLVLLACACWGLENNCTRGLSIRDPLQVVVIKGFGAGLGALLVTLLWGDFAAPPLYAAGALLLGFVAFGLSIYFYVSAQRHLGAARTSAYYAAAPFIGVLVSWTVLGEPVSATFFLALALMVTGTWFAIREKHAHRHLHLQETHAHRHSHDDGHHTHTHESAIPGGHSHVHTHDAVAHEHDHMPDTHHRHDH